MEANAAQKVDQAAPEAQKPARLAVGVQYRPAGKIYTFTTTDSELSVGLEVLVEAEGGTALGFVIIPPHESEGGEFPQNARKVLRRASREEIAQEAARREKALEYFLICQDKMRGRALPMKLVDALIEEDGKKAVFVFFAEQRVDFRALVKDLAGVLHMRIEMRQIGARDEAKYKGSLGPCGLMTCCSLHLRQFQSISISMAKHQGLAPNPAKLTGMCGKLKCCLAYEHQAYDELRKELPKVGTAVSSPRGPGRISGHNVLVRECVVRLYGGGEIRCPCAECRPLTPEERDAAIEAVKKAEEASEGRARRGGPRREGRDKGKDR